MRLRSVPPSVSAAGRTRVLATRPRIASALIALALIALAGCDLTDPGPVPDEIQAEPAVLDFAAFGAQEQIRATLLATDGAEIADAAFEFRSDDPEVASVDGAGRVLARGNGSTAVRVRSRGIETSVPVQIRQEGATLVAIAGRDQTAEIGQPLDPIRLQLTDPRGNLAAGVPLIARVERGGGLLARDTILTDEQGRAVLEWTLGAEVGPNQTVRVDVDPGRSATDGRTTTEITARALPGSPFTLDLMSPVELDAHRGLPLPDTVQARVLDIFGAPIEGARVRVEVEGRPPRTLESDSAGLIRHGWPVHPSLEPQQARLEVLNGLPDGELVRTVTVEPFSTPADLVPLVEIARTAPPGSQADPLRVRLLDEAELEVPDRAVAFRVIEGAARFADGPGTVRPDSATAVTGSDGAAESPPIELPDEPGSSRIEVRVQGTDVALTFVRTAQFPVGAVIVVEGDGQSAVEREILPSPVTVEVRGELGTPLAGVPVEFAAERGGVEFPLVITDEDGRAATRWRLGWGSGPERLWARADGVEATIVAESLPISGNDPGVHTPAPVNPSNHDIELILSDGVPVEARSTLHAAAARWDPVIVGDLSPVFLDLPADICANELPLLGTIDDLTVFVQVLEIDGPGGTAARAGPCYVRSAGALPIVGLVQFDTADLDRMIDNDLLFDVAVHELAHVLGFGTIWSYRNLLRNPADSADASIDTHFAGPLARAAFDSIGGQAWHDGTPVPVENQLGGSGTLNGHWRRSVFGHEVMTGFISPESSPLSAVTAASMADLGYEVALGEADPFTLSFAEAVRLRREPGVGGIDLGDDRHRGPIRVVDPARRQAPSNP